MEFSYYPYLLCVLLLIYAFVGWRFDIILFGLSNYELYFFYGVGAVAIPFLLFIWGYTFGLGVSVLSLLVLLYFFILNVLLDKNNEHDVPARSGTILLDRARLRTCWNVFWIKRGP